MKQPDHKVIELPRSALACSKRIQVKRGCIIAMVVLCVCVCVCVPLLCWAGGVIVRAIITVVQRCDHEASGTSPLC